jgi:hypothetical protein
MNETIEFAEFVIEKSFPFAVVAKNKIRILNPSFFS